MSIVTIANVRTTSGILVGEISDADVTALILEAQSSVEDFIGRPIEPRSRINVLTSIDYNGNKLMLNDSSILQIQAVDINDTSVTPKYVKNLGGGVIYLTSSAEKTTWYTTTPSANRIKVLVGSLEETTTQTTTSGDGVAGSSVVVAVTSGTSFTTGDYVKIEGVDGNSEVSIVTVSGNNLTFATLVYDHEAGSLVTKMDYPYALKRLIEVITAMMMVARIVGQSYTDIVGYSLGELHVQKGEPYTQWRETAFQLDRERIRLLDAVKTWVVL